MIRTILAAAAVLAAAAPALAFERASIPAPKQEAVGPAFLNFAGVARLVPEGTSEAFRFGDEQKPKGQTFVVEVGKGKPGGRLDVNDPRQNPFMAQPDRKAAPAQ